MLRGGRLDRAAAAVEDAGIGGDCCVGVGVEDDTVALFVDSVLVAARR